MTHAFSDLLEQPTPARDERSERALHRLRESDLLGKLVARALAAVDGETPPKGPDHPCTECLKLAEQYPEHPVSEAESWIGFAGYRYWAALCPDCVDRAWSKRWSAAFDEARKSGDLEVVHALERAREERKAKGRRVYA